MNKEKNILMTQRATPTSDGDGVKIDRIRAFNNSTLSPFLMLDELKSDESKDYIGGFPLHPHRGIETLSYMKKGHFRHEDHLGHTGEVASGGAQWMAAGRGVLHSEMPIMENGRLHSFQLWINQPAKLKMTKAAYQNLESDTHTIIKYSEHSNFRLISGGVQLNEKQFSGPLQQTGVPVVFGDWIVNDKDILRLTLPETMNTHVYVYAGSAVISGKNVQQGDLISLSKEGDLVIKGNGSSGFLIFAGEAIDEPVVHYGPFVMNSMQEIEQTLADFKAGKFEHY